MTPEERARRIAQRNRARLAAKRQSRAATDAALDEVMAAKADPEARLPYRRSAAIMGLAPQSLNEMLEAYRQRRALDEAQAEAG